MLEKTDQPSVLVVDLLKCLVHYQFPEKYLYPLVRKEGKETMRRLWDQDPGSGFKQLAAKFKRHVLHDQSQHADWVMPPVFAKSDTLTQIIHWYYDTLVWYLDNGHETPTGLAVKERMYAEAYEAGKLKTVVYPDAASCIRTWHRMGIRLILFSDSVHIHVQRLMLTHTNAGDLTPFFEAFYDLSALGDDASFQLRAESFTRLTALIRVPVADMLFLSGDPHTVRTAEESAAQSVLVLSHPILQFHAMGAQNVIGMKRIRSFDELKWKKKEPAIMTSDSSISSNESQSSKSKSGSFLDQGTGKQASERDVVKRKSGKQVSSRAEVHVSVV